MKVQSNLAAKRELSFLRPDAANTLSQLSNSLFVHSREHSSWQDADQSEMQLLIKQIESGNPWDAVVHNHMLSKGNDWLRRMVLSPSRALFLNLLELNGSETVLDLGSGWGQLTRELASRASSVISVEPNLERLKINHAINQQQQRDNICHIQANVFDLPLQAEAVDVAVLCGVLEWLGFDGNEDVGEMQQRGLKIIHDTLKPEAQILIAIENRTGLKYLLGEKDDHTATSDICYLPFEEAAATFLEQCNKPLRARTYDYLEYQKLLSNTGFKDIEIYLAFPDYKLPQVIIPATATKTLENFVANVGLPSDHSGLDGEVCKQAALLGRLYRAVNKLEVLHAFAPSFIIVGRKSNG